MKTDNVWNADSKSNYEAIKKMEKEMNEFIEAKLTNNQLDVDLFIEAYNNVFNPKISEKTEVNQNDGKDN